MGKADLPDEARRFIGYVKRRLNLVQMQVLIGILKQHHHRMRMGIGGRLLDYWENKIGSDVYLSKSKHPELTFRLIAIDDDLIRGQIEERTTGRLFWAALIHLANREAPIEEAEDPYLAGIMKKK